MLIVNSNGYDRNLGNINFNNKVNFFNDIL